jgi:hypothetical protein
MARWPAGAGWPGGRDARSGRRGVTAASAGSWVRPRRARRPAAAPGPADQVLGGEHQFQPDLVAAEQVERQVVQPGGLGGADAVLDPGAVAVAQLQPGQVGVGLVGQEDLEAVAVKVGEAQLGAGVGVLAAADRPGAFRPGVQVDPAGQLAGLGALARLAVGSTAGIQTCSGWARIASPTWASICMPRVKATSRSRRCQARRRLPPALSLRTRTGCWWAGAGSRARSTRSTRSSAAPGAALPGRRMPASGSPGAWPRSSYASSGANPNDPL